MFPKIKNVPHLTKDEMVQVDRLMEDKYKISLVQMMENAGSNLATVAKKLFLNNDIFNKTIYIFAGRGGNGGGAIAAGRWLHIGGADVHIIMSVPKKSMSGVPAHQLEIAGILGIGIREYSDDFVFNPRIDLIIDGIIGYGINGSPEGKAKAIIENINNGNYPILSLDIPSGIDPDKGNIFKLSITADATMTLALPKISFLNKNTKMKTGRILIADIGVPPQLYKNDMKIENTEHIFEKSDIVEIK